MAKLCKEKTVLIKSSNSKIYLRRACIFLTLFSFLACGSWVPLKKENAEQEKQKPTEVAEPEDEIIIPEEVSGAFLVGVTSDSEGVPLPNTEVYVRGDPSFKVRSNDAGVFEIKITEKAKSFQQDMVSIVALFKNDLQSLGVISAPFPYPNSQNTGLKLSENLLKLKLTPTGSFTGQIEPSTSGDEGGAQASVLIPGTDFRVAVVNGKFEMSGVPSGNWELVIEKEGFVPKAVPETVVVESNKQTIIEKPIAAPTESISPVEENPPANQEPTTEEPTTPDENNTPEPEANSPPSSLTLDNLNILENAPAGTIVGNLSAIDTDSSDILTFTLVPGNGDKDNASFKITDNQVLTNLTFDFETKNAYSIRVSASDGKDSVEKSFEISIIDVDESINLVFSTANYSNLDISSGTSPGATINLNLQNTGGASSGNLNTPILSGTNPENFEIVSNGCLNLALGSNQSCSVSIRPIASGNGSYSATLSMTDGSETSNTVNLSGTASGFGPPAWTNKASLSDNNYLIVASTGYVPHVLDISVAPSFEPVISAVHPTTKVIRNYQIDNAGTISNLDSITVASPTSSLLAMVTAEMSSDGDLFFVSHENYNGGQMLRGWRLNPTKTTGTQVGTSWIDNTTNESKDNFSMSRMGSDILLAFKGQHPGGRLVQAVRLRADTGGSDNNVRIFKLDGTSERTSTPGVLADAIIDPGAGHWIDSPQIAYSATLGIFATVEMHTNYGFNGNIAGKITNQGVDGPDGNYEVDDASELDGSYSGNGVSNLTSPGGLKSIKLITDSDNNFISIAYKWNANQTPQPLYLTKNNGTTWKDLRGTNLAIPNADYIGEKSNPIGVCGTGEALLVGYPEVASDGSTVPEDVVVLQFHNGSWSEFFRASVDVPGSTIKSLDGSAMDMADDGTTCYLTWTNGSNIYGAKFTK